MLTLTETAMEPGPLGKPTSPEETAADGRLMLASTFRRTIQASEERIWENVFDWEHLPALHDTYFNQVEKLAIGDWGWRLRLSRQPGTPDRAQVLELLVDRPRHRYTVLTLEGVGAGTRFWTCMARARRTSPTWRCSISCPPWTSSAWPCWARNTWHPATGCGPRTRA